MRIWIALLLSLFLCLPISAHDWSATIHQVERSIVRLTAEAVTPKGEEYTKICTGFTINRKQQYVMTDYHCLGTSLKVDTVLSYVVKGDRTLDLAIVANYATVRPALSPSRKIPFRGLPVAAVGYGFGEMSLTVKTGGIMAPRFVWGVDDPSPPYFLTDFGFIGGMSGGPVVDSEGRVVSICQRTDPDTSTGLGQPLSVMMAFAGGLWD